MKELEEDYAVYSEMGYVHEIVLANEAKCNEFKEHYVKYSYLWTKDLPTALKVRTSITHAQG